MKKIIAIILFSSSMNLWAMGAVFNYADPEMGVSFAKERTCLGSEITHDPRINSGDHR